MTASLKESVHPPAADLHVEHGGLTYSKRDEEFVRILKEAGLVQELEADELQAIAEHLTEDRVDSRRLEIVELYYLCETDAASAARRRAADRFFFHHDEFTVTAHDVVSKLAEVNAEIASMTLQRIGSEEGPLVLRAGDHFSAVTDEEDDQGATGTVAVRALVRALNALLSKAQVGPRMVPLMPDETRELYVGVTEEGAMTLLQGGCTEISAVQALREFASW